MSKSLFLCFPHFHNSIELFQKITTWWQSRCTSLFVSPLVKRQVRWCKCYHLEFSLARCYMINYWSLTNLCQQASTYISTDLVLFGRVLFMCLKAPKIAVGIRGFTNECHFSVKSQNLAVFILEKSSVVVWSWEFSISWLDDRTWSSYFK